MYLEFGQNKTFKKTPKNVQIPGLNSRKYKPKPLHKIDDCHVVFKWGEKFLHFILDAHFQQREIMNLFSDILSFNNFGLSPNLPSG